MKICIRFLAELLTISIVVVLWNLIYSGYSPSTIAVAVATVLGLSLTIVGTLIGIIAIIKSHKATIRQHELFNKEMNQKLAHEIYDNLLIPLQYVLIDVSNLIDSLLEQQKKSNVNIMILESISTQLDGHANEFNAKLNMIILYADKENTITYLRPLYDFLLQQRQLLSHLKLKSG